MTLDELRTARLDSQRRHRLRLTMAAAKARGVTEVLVDHRDFVRLWQLHPQWSRRARLPCDPMHPYAPQTFDIRSPMTPALRLLPQQEPLGVAYMVSLPYLDPGYDIPWYSAWYLPHDDPCWEGHVQYALDPTISRETDASVEDAYALTPEVFTHARNLSPDNPLDTRREPR